MRENVSNYCFVISYAFLTKLDFHQIKLLENLKFCFLEVLMICYKGLDLKLCKIQNNKKNQMILETFRGLQAELEIVRND